MRTVFSNNEIVHVFSQRSQSNGKSYNMFFYNDILYSYGYHYELAKFIDLEDQSFILIDDLGYSVSTSKHISLIRRASRHHKQYFTTDVELRHVYNGVKEAYKKLLKAIKPEQYINKILSLYESYTNYPLYRVPTNSSDLDKHNEICEIFNTINNVDSIESAKAYQKEIDKQKRIAEKNRISESLEKFLNYEISQFRIGNEDFIRISQDQESVETTQGVKVPCNEAKILYKMILAGKDIKGYKIGYYMVISINGHLKIGCHNINIDNMHNVGQKLLKM